VAATRIDDPTVDDGLVTLLDAQGTRRASPEFDPFVADVADADLLDLYREMRIIRRVDDEGTALQRQGELALWPPLKGQEAAQIGSAHALRAGDFAFTSYREHGVAFVRGVPIANLGRVWRGSASAGWNPYDVGMQSPQVIIGAQSLHATGYAIGIQHDGADDVAIAYFGDGAMSEGDVNEAFVFAASFQAPVVFLCQNNQWAISEPVSLQSPVPLAQRPPGFGIPSVRVDGNDVLAMLAVTRAAVERARTGGGPTFIEAFTYRMGPHTTADDPTRYRDAERLEEWALRDPIARVEAYLRGAGTLDDEVEREVTEAADAAAAELRAGTVQLPDPEPASLFDHIYAEPHTGVERQRAEFLHYLESFEEPDGIEKERTR
jgi:pyruvate dehydrogenase E1 component alpha subunit